MTARKLQTKTDMNEESKLEKTTDEAVFPATCGSGLGTPMTESPPTDSPPTLGRLLLQAMMYRKATLQIHATDGGALAVLKWYSRESLCGNGRNAAEALETLNRNCQEDAADEYLQEVGL